MAARGGATPRMGTAMRRLPSVVAPAMEATAASHQKRELHDLINNRANVDDEDTPILSTS